MPIDFQKSIELMVDSGVRFVVIGGVAMRMQGSAHVTDDIDFSYARDAEGLPGLVEITQVATYPKME